KGANEFFGVDGSHATDHAGREIFFDAVGRSWWRCAQEPRLELLAMGAVVDPFAGGRDPLASGNGCGMANHGHGVTMPARPCAQNAKTILGVVVGYSLDEAREHFLGRRFGRGPHAHYIQSRHRAHQMPVGWGCLAASGSFLKLRTRRGSRASSFGCKKSAEDVLRWNFDLPIRARARRSVLSHVKIIRRAPAAGWRQERKGHTDRTCCPI